MTTRTGFYIGGEWVTPAGNRTLRLINPATEEPSGELLLGEQADVDRAVTAARNAFPSYAASPIADRTDTATMLLRTLVLAFSLAAVALPRIGACGRWMGATLLIGYVAFLWIQF